MLSSTLNGTIVEEPFVLGASVLGPGAHSHARHECATSFLFGKGGKIVDSHLTKEHEWSLWPNQEVSPTGAGRAKSFLAFQGDSKLHPVSFKGVFNPDKSQTAGWLLEKCMDQDDCENAIKQCKGKGTTKECMSDEHARAAVRFWRKSNEKGADRKALRKQAALEFAQSEILERKTMIGLDTEEAKLKAKFVQKAGAACTAPDFRGTYCETKKDGDKTIDYKCLSIPYAVKKDTDTASNQVVQVCVDGSKEKLIPRSGTSECPEAVMTSACVDPPCPESSGFVGCSSGD